MECTLADVTLHYETRGEGRPVLMLHGLPLDHRHMLAEMEPVFEGRTGWQRFYLDMPGMGQSAGSEAITHPDHMLDVLLEFMDAVAPGQRFVVAGMSYGGYLARGLVHRRGAQIDGVMMSVPVVVMDGSQRILPSRVTLVQDEALLAELDPALREGVKNMAVAQSRRVVEHWQAVITPAVEAADHAFVERAGLGKNFSFHAAMDADQFAGPTLIVTGRQDDVCGYEQAWGLVAQYPRATFAVLDTAGHCLPTEQEALYTVLLNDWLDRVERELKA